MLEAKNYKVKIVGSFTGESAEKKTPYYGLELETACGNFIDFVAYLTDKTAKRNLETLTKAGFIGKKISDLSNPDYSIEEIFSVNPDLTATIEHEEYTNKDGEIKTKAVVKWLNTGSFGPQKADYKQSVKIFNGTKFDGMMKEMQKQLNVSIPTRQEIQEGQNADDLPF